jgi:serine/threonine protein kinase
MCSLCASVSALRVIAVRQYERSVTAAVHTYLYLHNCVSASQPHSLYILVQGELVVIDLGGAVGLNNSYGAVQCATYAYCAPEFHSRSDRVGPASDYYSLGEHY